MEHILEQLHTESERDLLLEEIDTLLASLYENQGHSFDSILRAHVRSWIRDLMLADFTREETDREAYLKKLRSLAVALPSVTLVLAYDPPYSSIELFSRYIKKEKGSSVLIRIQYNPELLAGAQIVSDGKYKDLSLRPQFLETMKDLQKSFS
jgi:hypothetical protein